MYPKNFHFNRYLEKYRPNKPLLLKSLKFKTSFYYFTKLSNNNEPTKPAPENPSDSKEESGENQNDINDLLSGPFLTGVEIDVDQWRAQTIEELQGWLDGIKNKTTSMGDPLVDFPQDWDPEKVLTQKQQFDMISDGITRDLKGAEAKEAQTELQSIRAQAEKIRQLDKVLNQLEDDDEDLFPQLPPEDEDLLNTDIVIPNIDTSGPNPFELDEATSARLKEIDAKLGIDEKTEAEIAAKQPKRTMDEINDELLKLYQNQTDKDEKSASDQKKSDQKPPEPAPTPAPSKESATDSQISSPVKGAKPRPLKGLKTGKQWPH